MTTASDTPAFGLDLRGIARREEPLTLPSGRTVALREMTVDDFRAYLALEQRPDDAQLLALARQVAPEAADELGTLTIPQLTKLLEHAATLPKRLLQVVHDEAVRKAPPAKAAAGGPEGNATGRVRRRRPRS